MKDHRITDADYKVAPENAREQLNQESCVTMTARDFGPFTTALNGAFTPNAALQNALTAARDIKRD
jgi:uncharacterized protein (DUF1778 family)